MVQLLPKPSVIIVLFGLLLMWHIRIWGRGTFLRGTFDLALAGQHARLADRRGQREVLLVIVPVRWTSLCPPVLLISGSYLVVETLNELAWIACRLLKIFVLHRGDKSACYYSRGQPRKID